LRTSGRLMVISAMPSVTSVKRVLYSTLVGAVSTVVMANYRNAARPVMACPMISVWTSSVPS
jgi:hypothetical protein